MSRDTGPLKAAFEQALALEGSAREQWLAELHVTEPEMAARIRRMLAFDAQKIDPLSHPIESLKQSLEFDAGAWLGQELAGFRLQRLIGEGGMGAVYLAQRIGQDFEQQAALKLLRGHWLGEHAARRFADEARILARLHHANIATFIDAGTSDDGRPFLVMEYIDGVPLLEYCDAARLGVWQRLHLARGLLSALMHAHRQLVVHRDLKPANVLVTADGTPKLLDFGIARLTDGDPANTATMTRPFTPGYASPEQLTGEPVGTTSDVYSLGLVLYELCVGVLPWEAHARSRAGATTTMPIVRLQQLDAEHRTELAAKRHCDVRALSRSLRGDLGRVLTHCLEADPAARYATVEALQRDLDAVLARRPPPGLASSRSARAASFARRHAWPLALTALLLVAGAVVLAQSLLAERRLAVERDHALAAATQARIESTKSRQIADFAQTMLSGIDPDRAQGMDRSLMRLVLDSAGQRAQQQLAGQPEVRTAVERTIAISYNSIGAYEPAIQHFDAALDAARHADDDRATRVGLLTDKARVLSNLGHHEQAGATIKKALHLATALPADGRQRLFAESNRAAFHCDAAQFVACRKGYARVLPIQKREFGVDDKQTLESMRGLAYADSELGRYRDARALYQQLIPAARKYFGDTNSRTLDAINGLAITWLQQKQFGKAEKLLKPAVAQAEKTFGPDHPLTINMLSNLGGAIRQQPGRNAEARPYYERVLAATRKLYGPDSRRTVFAQINLALLLRDAGELLAAEQHARTGLRHMDKALGHASPYRGILLDKLASILIQREKFAAAQQALDRAHAILKQARGFGPQSEPMQSVIRHYVALYQARGEPQQAARWKKRLLPSSDKNPHSD